MPLWPASAQASLSRMPRRAQTPQTKLHRFSPPPYQYHRTTHLAKSQLPGFLTKRSVSKSEYCGLYLLARKTTWRGGGSCNPRKAFDGRAATKMRMLVGISKLRPGSSEQDIGAMRLGDTMLKELGQAMSVTGHIGRLFSNGVTKLHRHGHPQSSCISPVTPLVLEANPSAMPNCWHLQSSKPCGASQKHVLWTCLI